MSKLAEKLKPCRICGDKPFLFTCKDCINGKQQTLYLICCSNPYCAITTIPYDDFNELRELWNGDTNPYNKPANNDTD